MVGKNYSVLGSGGMITKILAAKISRARTHLNNVDPNIKGADFNLDKDLI